MRLQRECQAKLRLLEGKAAPVSAGAARAEPLPFRVALRHPEASQYFRAFLDDEHWGVLLSFVDDHAGFRAAVMAAAASGSARAAAAASRDMARSLFEEYFSPTAPLNLRVPGSVIAAMVDALDADGEADDAGAGQSIPATFFDAARAVVVRALEADFYPNFLRSVHYTRCTQDLGADAAALLAAVRWFVFFFFLMD